MAKTVESLEAGRMKLAALREKHNERVEVLDEKLNKVTQEVIAARAERDKAAEGIPTEGL